jgi:VanZ family protein
MLQRFAAYTAWASIVLITYATLAHARFVYAIYFKLSPFLMRVDMGVYVHLEHVLAFALFGALFTFAYPRHIAFVFCIVMTSAVILECLQTLTPDRHGTLVDACEKMAGGVIGILAASAALMISRNHQRSVFVSWRRRTG